MNAFQKRLEVEALESRDCPAVNFFNGVLTLTGTSGDDTLTVTQTGSTISAEGQSFDAASVKRIVITGLDGKDTITNNTSIVSNLYGGNGDDIITGGMGVDHVFGGHGNDTITGKAGNDIIYGGAGADTLMGGAGQNTMVQGDQNLTKTNSTIEQQIINLVNQERKKVNLPPLTVNLELNAAAWLHTQDMVNISNGYGPNTGMQHILLGTPRPQVSDRLDAVGYDNWTSSFTWGENIAYGYASAQAVMTGWMNSQGHRDNILNPNFTEIGVSVVADASGRLFFTQDFGHMA